MNTIPIHILDFQTRKPVSARLLLDVSAEQLFKTEVEWGPFRLQAMKRLVNSGYPKEQLPLHWHWNWGSKSTKLGMLAYQCFGIECKGKIEGLMLLNLEGHTTVLPPDQGKPLIYVDYLETAPWNVKPLVDVPVYSELGRVLMLAAVQRSIDEGFHGRVGLHSLPNSEVFYRDKIGMTFVEKDLSNHLSYYEMKRKDVSKSLFDFTNKKKT